MRVQFLGGEDSQEEAVATHSSILPWEIPQTEEPRGLQSIRSQKVGHDSPRAITEDHCLIPP